MGEVKPITLSKIFLITIPLFFVTLIVTVFSLKLGSVNIDFTEIFSILFSESASKVNSQIILELRLPRIMLAIAVGGGLSVSGVVFQAILMNPLAEPYILGVSSGGTFGAILGVVLGFSMLSQQMLAFAGAFLVIFIVFSLGKRFGIIDPTTMLLSGVMTGAFFSSLILLMMTFVNSEFRTTLFWLLGNLSLAKIDSIYFIFPSTVLIVILLNFFSNKFNLISMGDESARHLGVKSSAIRTIGYLLSSMLVGIVVSVSGIIGFVGLLIPHICRLLFGVDNRILIPVSFFVGAIFLIITDAIARTILSPAEIPVGVITAVLGAPLFIYLLRVKNTKAFF